MNAKGLLGFVLLFDIVAVLILYPRLDLFSCGYLVLSTVLALLQALVSQRFSKSPEIQRLFYAKDIDKVWDRYVPVLGFAEFAVFFEYARWRPVPELLQHALQMLGLLLCIVGVIWLAWVDSYLIDAFPSHFRRGALMTCGPYRFVRHPRYVGLLATRLSLPLIFGSVIAWLLAAIWILLIHRRAHLEERYLLSKFGAEYTTYASRVPSLL